MLFPRFHAALLREMLETFPVVAVVGARQTGKSTLVTSPGIGGGRSYLSLDDLATRGLARTDPVALLRNAPKVTVDEAQREPDLLLRIKQEVDRKREPGRFLLTGSADLEFTAGLSRVLAGRVGLLHLRPLTWREKARRAGEPRWLSWADGEFPSTARSDLEAFPLPRFDPDLIFTGGYPPAVTASSARSRFLWMESFRVTYLERDVRQVSQIQLLTEFARFIELAAARTGQILKIAELGRDAGLNPVTAGRYLSVLEASFLVERLPPWHANLSKRLVKSPKLYFTDAGLAAHLMGLRGIEDARAAGAWGALVETFVFLEVKAALEAFRPEARLYFAAAHSGFEIDGLVVEGRRVLPFEVKASATVTGDDARAIKAYLEADRRAPFGLVFFDGDAPLLLDRGVLAVPFGGLLA